MRSRAKERGVGYVETLAAVAVVATAGALALRFVGGASSDTGQRYAQCIAGDFDCAPGSGEASGGPAALATAPAAAAVTNATQEGTGAGSADNAGAAAASAAADCSWEGACASDEGRDVGAGLHMLLDALSWSPDPVVGRVANAAEGVLDLKDGDQGGAALAFAAVVPVGKYAGFLGKAVSPLVVRMTREAPTIRRVEAIFGNVEAFNTLTNATETVKYFVRGRLEEAGDTLILRQFSVKPEGFDYDYVIRAGRRTAQSMMTSTAEFLAKEYPEAKKLRIPDRQRVTDGHTGAEFRDLEIDLDRYRRGN